MVAAESGSEGTPGDEKDDRLAACKGSQAERTPSLKGKYAPGTSTAVRGTLWEKKKDNGPHGCDVLQTTYDKHLSSSAVQEKQALVEGGTAEAATPTPTMVKCYPSRPGHQARARTRLTRGALNAVPERYDVMPWGTQEAARRRVIKKRRRQNIRAGSR
ncbi:hypothetical protein MRX96_032845 [Rhipicephalus microplus]